MEAGVVVGAAIDYTVQSKTNEVYADLTAGDVSYKQAMKKVVAIEAGAGVVEPAQPLRFQEHRSRWRAHEHVGVFDVLLLRLGSRPELLRSAPAIRANPAIGRSERW